MIILESKWPQFSFIFIIKLDLSENTYGIEHDKYQIPTIPARNRLTIVHVWFCRQNLLQMSNLAFNWSVMSFLINSITVTSMRLLG